MPIGINTISIGIDHNANFTDTFFIASYTQIVQFITQFFLWKSTQTLILVNITNWWRHLKIDIFQMNYQLLNKQFVIMTFYDQDMFIRHE